ncbi:RNA polymerase sigma factor [Crossiella sp. SN42]|uniref:RNA polymerase sigma factor n=1 Tax=Crossiella sp. SN42 TaxID=2944808 RepID=UPI00207C8117|nr:RNA polymerase sigma factor [Crossiella sp. SN42]MCO1576162.1 RNA polymerase sigma factor [Crossiella sp. SN42]
MGTSIRARLRAGDPVAFGELFDEHAAAVHRHATRVTGNSSTAEDVVSLTFLEAWRVRERLDPEGDSVRPWLFGIAVNVLRNTARAARRHQLALTKLPPPESVPDFTDELVGRWHDGELLDRAKAALAKLRRAEREVVTLCVWAGLDYAETAQALGIPVGTVRSRLSRARAKLRSLAAEPPPRAGQVAGDQALSTQESFR